MYVSHFRENGKRVIATAGHLLHTEDGDGY